MTAHYSETAVNFSAMAYLKIATFVGLKFRIGRILDVGAPLDT